MAEIHLYTGIGTERLRFLKEDLIARLQLFTDGAWNDLILDANNVPAADAKSNIVFAADSGAAFNNTTADQVTINDWLASSDVPSGSVVQFPAGKAARIQSAIVFPPAKSLIVNAKGFTFRVDNATQGTRAMQRTETFNWYDIDSFQQSVDYTINSVTARLFSAFFVPVAQATPANFPEGRKVKIISDDQLAGGSTNSREGTYSSTIVDIDTADALSPPTGMRAIVISYTPNLARFATNPRAGITANTFFRLEGGSIVYDEAQVRAGTTDSQAMRFIGGRFVSVDPEFISFAPGRHIQMIGVENAVGPGKGCYMFNTMDSSHSPKVYPGVNGITAGNRVPYFTYGISFVGCGLSYVGPMLMQGGRHVRDDEVVVIATPSEAMRPYHGVSDSSLTDGIQGTGQTGAAIGTHGASSKGSSIVGAIVEGCLLAAYNMRGATFLDGVQAKDCRGSVDIFRGDSTEANCTIGNAKFINSGKILVRDACTLDLIGGIQQKGSYANDGNMLIIQGNATVRVQGSWIMEPDKNGGSVINIQNGTGGATFDCTAGQVIIRPNGWDGASAGTAPIPISWQLGNNNINVRFGDRRFIVYGGDWSVASSNYSSAGSGTVRVTGYPVKQASVAVGSAVVFALGGWLDLFNNDDVIRLMGNHKRGIATVSGTAYTLGPVDIDRALRFTSADAVTLTIPTDANVVIPVGCEWEWIQGGAGVVTATGDTGVNLRVPAGKTAATLGQYAQVRMKQGASNERFLTGDLANA